MTRQKWLLAISAAALVGWLSWLGYAVAFHRLNPPDVVSRSQLLASTYVVVAEVTVQDGRPAPSVTVVHKLDGTGPDAGGTLSVVNLPDATTPANKPLPGSGRYLLGLVPDRGEGFRIAGWPRGLGEFTTEPGQVLPKADDDKPGDPPRVRPPLAYPWTDAVQKQMSVLGYKW
ncbi:MAG: hypothetical protein MUF18_03525 [Fimbriiglobus sp.]|jgi:hypothetical protein|nr:hypothetical protein [Fimbriiglobus sp.]